MKSNKILFLTIFFLVSSAQAQVTVLTYHSISDKHNDMATTLKTFENQINYLIFRKVSFINSHTLVNSIINKQELPNNSVVLTFDDGWKNQVLAMKFLSEKNIPATFGLVTQFQKINSVTCLQKEDLTYFSKSDFTYVNHSFTHDIKKFLVNPEEDLNKSEDELEKLKSLNIDIAPYYIYPYGKKNTLLVDAIKKHHYIAAFGVNGIKFFTTKVDIFNIPRFLVNEKTDLTKLF